MKVGIVIPQNFNRVQARREKPANFVNQQPNFGNNYAYAHKEAVILLKTLDYLPCAYCGRKMVSAKLVENFPEHVVSADLSPKQLTKAVISTIFANLTRIEHPKAELFRRILARHEENPDMTLREIFKEMRPEHLKQLEHTQLSVMEKIDNLAVELPDKTLDELLQLTQEQRIMIDQDDETHLFSRKPFIHKVRSLLRESPNEKVNEQIRELACSLPTSDNNINAFVVKYSNKSDAEALNGFLKRSVASVEHVKRQAEFPLGGNKKDAQGNLLLVHQRCNDQRGEVTFHQHIRSHEEIPANIQHQADFIMNAINASVLPFFMKRYLTDLKTNLLNLTKKTLSLNLYALSSDKQIITHNPARQGKLV